MNSEKKWKTTDKLSGPSGRKVSGTFRDVSMTAYSPEFIDEVDSLCVDYKKKRSEIFKLAERVGTPNPTYIRHYLDSRGYE